jgi:hypothetical protein
MSRPLLLLLLQLLQVCCCLLGALSQGSAQLLPAAAAQELQVAEHVHGTADNVAKPVETLANTTARTAPVLSG